MTPTRLTHALTQLLLLTIAEHRTVERWTR